MQLLFYCILANIVDRYTDLIPTLGKITSGNNARSGHDSTTVQNCFPLQTNDASSCGVFHLVTAIVPSNTTARSFYGKVNFVSGCTLIGGIQAPNCCTTASYVLPAVV